jgi:sugar O-acyltransferase (sialic acid O-acetyltransferase NeuD family)
MAEGIIIIGAGGHGKVIADIIVKSGDALLGFLDDGLPVGNEVLGYPILGLAGDALKYAGKAKFILGIGDNRTRKYIAEAYGLPWHTAIHPSAVIAADTAIGEGTAVMAGAVINPSACIGRHCVVNSAAVVEHDNILEDYVHLSPKAATGGTVTIGTLTHIGIGAVVKNDISIAGGTTIGAGAVVVRNITEGGVYVGIPAKRK